MEIKENVKVEKMSWLERANIVQDKISKKWRELAKDSYICYSMWEVGYKVAYDILESIYGENQIIDVQIYYRKMKDRFKMAFYIEDDITLTFDAYWVTGMYGDSSIQIGNGKIGKELSKLYEIYEEDLESEEE